VSGDAGSGVKREVPVASRESVAAGAPAGQPRGELADRRYPLSDAWRERAHRVIPGGCHTYYKGDDRYPLLGPACLVRGLGSRVWDADGHSYLEYGQGNRSVILGHAEPRILAAVAEQLQHGSSFNRASPVEVLAAEQFLALVTTAEMVKFCKNGSDATSAAVRLARAVTGRPLVAYCRDHPFFASEDWFVGTRQMAAGVPEAVRKLVVDFPFNDLAAVDELLDRHRGQIAALILEPARYDDPTPEFLAGLRRRCDAHGLVLIFDEMITGFRWHLGGAQAYYGVTPDLSTFGKALGNGFSVSALAGKRDLMERGGIRTAQPRVFLLSSTHGGETHALAAALRCMQILESEPVLPSLARLGQRLRSEGERLVAAQGLSDHFQFIGHPWCLSYLLRDASGEESLPLRTLWMQEMIRGGILMPSLVVGYAHQADDIDWTLEVMEAGLKVLAAAIEEGVERFLIGPAILPIDRP
jgi:glutamate-1-semialdehyde 2,1-aminomutase